MSQRFTATIFKVGINPCVDVPADISTALGKKGYIPVRVILNGCSFRAGLVSLGEGRHRLYINGVMRKQADVDLGDRIDVTLDYDDTPRKDPIPKSLTEALQASTKAKQAWENLTPSRRREILRYLNNLKGPDSLARNVQRVIRQLAEPNNEDTGIGWRHRP
jgi:hypothetical protein